MLLVQYEKEISMSDQYSPTDEIRRILKLDIWPDFFADPTAFAAKRRPDIAPLAYEISVNKPLGGNTLDKIVGFANGADAALTRRLYSLCNGIRIGATKFGVYGVVGQIDRGSDAGAAHPPLNINIPNIYERPADWPDDHLIVGFSREPDNSERLIHAITPNGSIIVAGKGNHLAPYRTYFSVESWLQAEVERALANKDRF